MATVNEILIGTDIVRILNAPKITRNEWFFYCGSKWKQGKTAYEAAKEFHENNHLKNYIGFDDTLKQAEGFWRYMGGNRCNKNGTQRKDVKSIDKIFNTQYTREELIKLFYVNFKPLQIDFRIPDNVFNGAIAYFEHGFHVVPVGTEKKPLIKWRKPIDYATWQLNPSHLDKGYWDNGIAILGTDKHVFLDIDKKSNKHPDGIEQSEIERIRTLFKGWHMETSINGGLHIWAYGNLSKIDSRAYINATEEGLTIKGKGSYIVAAPSPGYTPLR